jgi:tetratricopeptide (TPR) repeat protein
MRNVRRWSALLILGALVMGVPRASAQSSDEQARDLFQRGDSAYVEGRYEAALGLFQEAYQLSQRPRLLFNIANTLERLGRVPDAIEALRRYLPEATETERPVVERRIASMEERESRRRAMEERDDEETRVRPAPPPAAEVRSQQSAPVGPIVVMVLGAAGVGAGIGLGVWSGDLGSAARQDCASAAGAGTLCRSDARADLDGAKSAALGADVAWSLGAAAMAGGLIWLIVELSQGSSSETAVTARDGRLSVAF